MVFLCDSNEKKEERINKGCGDADSIPLDREKDTSEDESFVFHCLDILEQVVNVFLIIWIL